MTVPLEEPRYRQRRSNSQLSEYLDCGYKYYLKRVASKQSEETKRPSWSLIGGRATHRVIEAFEKKATYAETSNVKKAWPDPAWTKAKFKAFFLEEIEEEIAISAGSEFEHTSTWFAAAKGKEDFSWWLSEGAHMMEMYAEMNPSNRGFHTLILEPGKLALELEIEYDWDGVPQLMYIDHVTVDSFGVLDIIDYKSGKSMPSDGGLQVITGVHAVQKMFPDRTVRGGNYYHLRTGKLSRLYETKEIPYEAIVHLYHEFDRSEREEIYLPRVSSYCSGCQVRNQCVFGGSATELVKIDKED